MKLRIFAIRDTKAEAYLPPFFERTNETAIRAVQKATTEDPNFQTYAEDYSLWELGTFNDSNGIIDARKAPVHLANLVDIRDQTEAVTDLATAAMITTAEIKKQRQKLDHDFLRLEQERSEKKA